MSINLVTYANQTVTPTNDAIIYERAIDQNGIFHGCNVTVSSNNVNITGGYGIVCGREFVIESESIPVTLAPSVPLDGRLYVRLDLADADNPIQLLTAQGATLPALEQDADVNYVNGAWEMELATFTVGVSDLSDCVETYETIIGTKAFLTDKLTPSNYFVTSAHSPSGNITLNSGADTSSAFTVTKAGYYPLGVVGQNIGYVSGANTRINVVRLRLTSVSNGSATVGYGLYNTGTAAATFSLTVDILWAKIV